MSNQIPQAPQVQNTVLTEKKSSRNWLLFLPVIIFSIIVVSLAAYLFIPNNLEGIKFLDTNEPVMFLDKNDPRLLEHGEYFGFETKLTGYDDSTNEIKIDLSGKNVPKIIYSRATVLNQRLKDGSFNLITLKPLETGQNVFIVISYDKKRSVWKTRSITLLDEIKTEQSATASAIGK